MSSDDSNEVKTSRRDALKLGLIGFATSLPLAKALAAPEHHDHHSAKSPTKKMYLFFTKEEAQFVEAAVARLIPKDDLGGGAIEAGVPTYIDMQLAGSWGAGERLYRSGPWKSGTPQQGYQLPFTPAEFFRIAMKALNRELDKKKTPFHTMSIEDQEAFLRELEKSDRDLDGIPAKMFFSSLLKSSIEGFLADPVYGGNKDMMAWRMIGFPGAGASYYELVDKHGINVTRRPISIAEDGGGHVHVNPNIPAHMPGK
jgi:gluconate 2-dehydrogenase gamma chain